MACMRNGFEQDKLLDGRFLTVSPLNHGSFGMVFAARDTFTGNDVAIKCITKADAVNDLPSCPTAVAMAIDDRSEELEIHSRLSEHPNIVNLVNHFENEHHQYMVLELCSNGDLYEAIRIGKGPLETEHVRDFMLQLVNAVDHLHTNGVYHRDIKPENIFLTSDGSMKLGDFGLATMDTWSTEFAVGSDRYMAPEQYDASVYGYGYSPASADIWAIGIVMLNVLFQRNPFATPTPKDPLFADFARDRQSLFDVFPNLSQDTYNVLVHSLALDPANRSLAAVREALYAAVCFTTDDEALDDFCTAEQTELVPVATAAREPLRTPSITSPNPGSDSFPWASALLKTPQKTTRQLSTIRDEEPDMFPGSVQSEWQYVDMDEASLSSNHDSGLGMSYKSSKSSISKPTTTFVGSLPISFSRPAAKSSPYGGGNTGFSKSWSDLYDEEEEEMDDVQRRSFEHGMDISRVSTAKPCTPQLNAICDDDRGSVTPRAGVATLANNSRAVSPLRKLIEEDKKHEESPKQRSSSILDKWSALGNFRRAKVEPPPQTTVPAATPAAGPGTTTVTASPTPQRKASYVDAFASFSPFAGIRKPKTVQTPAKSRERSSSWRQGSPARLRSGSSNNSRVWERKDKEPSPAAPISSSQQGAWSLDNNWRAHRSPVALKAQQFPPPSIAKQSSHPEKNFLTAELDDTDDMWVGGWKDFQL